MPLSGQLEWLWAVVIANLDPVNILPLTSTERKLHPGEVTLPAGVADQPPDWRVERLSGINLARLPVRDHVRTQTPG